MAERVVRAYYVLDRETGVDFPAGTTDLIRGFDANGNGESVFRGSGVWTYQYDVTDRLMQERLAIDAENYPFNYVYDAAGGLVSRENVHSATVIAFSPNALGRARGVSVGVASYVSGVSYHANGETDDAAYLNGQLFDQTLNNRQRPQELRTWKPGGQTALHHVYGYEPGPGRAAAVKIVVSRLELLAGA